jgi:hypothetical protein
VILPPKISIKAKVHGKQDDHIISQVEKPHDEFNHDILIPILEKYIVEQVRLNRKGWAYTVKPAESKIKEKDIIIFSIDNSAQQVEFNKNKEEFTQFLRDQLNNQFVTIQSEYKEKEETMMKTIDPLQKFDNMVKENPLLVDLKNTFKLDL